MVLMSFLSQISIAQNDIQGTITVNGTEFSSVGAFNYNFSLSTLLLNQIGEPFDVEKLYDGEEMMSAAEDIYQPFIETGLDYRLFFHEYSLTPLIYAVVNEDVDAVNSIMEQEGVNPDLQDSNGLTALIWAVIIGNEGMVRAFVDAGADM